MTPPLTPTLIRLEVLHRMVRIVGWTPKARQVGLELHARVERANAKHNKRRKLI